MNLPLLHRGSVKDIYRKSERELVFRYSDRYSIFDWGEMPDPIPEKGKALAQMGGELLSRLSKKGIPTHFLAFGDDPRDIIVREVSVPRQDISIYQSRPENILIPLEVIYRLGVPKGSSLLKRHVTEQDWKSAGFDRQYFEGEFFGNTHIDFTTKLERQDRVLSESEAQLLAGMSAQEWSELKSLTIRISKELQEIFGSFGALLWDGKLEFGLDENRRIILVDSIGLDEMRLSFEGLPLSKEILRQVYLQSSWYRALQDAKKNHPEDFRNHCETVLHETPAPLDRELLGAISKLYLGTAELIAAKPEASAESIETLKNAYRVIRGYL